MKSVRFLHVPKTAGSTFSRILANQYSGRKRFVFQGSNSSDIERFRQMPVEDQASVELFTGHAPMHTGIPEADSIPIITILRDPVLRVKSFCQHVSEGKSPHLLNTYPPETFTLDAFLTSDNDEVSNLQTRMLIDFQRHDSSSTPDEISWEDKKTLALENLFKKITCFGLQEYFDESLILFSDNLGWRLPVYEYRNKKNVKRLLNFEKRHMDKIKELNAIDIELYDSAKERFLEILQSNEFNRSKYRVFKNVQKIASPVLHYYGNAGRGVKKLFRSLL